MSTTPTQLLPYTVNSVLDYITAPSHVLPFHLISKSLLQRHHFLNPQLPEEYLCWPSAHQQRTIALIDALRVDRDECTSYPIRYFSDDQTYAHVAITSDLRLVFQWDAFHEWKYHDASLMPFPPGCVDSLQDAILKSLQNGDDPDHKVSAAMENDTAEDSRYWDSYGQECDVQDDGMSDYVVDDTEGDTEDQYWAQYAAVLGDSTIPSPPHRNRSKHAPAAEQKQTEPIICSLASLNPRKHTYLEPPSPTALTAALNALSYRPSRVYFEDSVSDLDMQADAAVSHVPPNSRQKVTPHVDDDEQEQALRESIRGIYGMWISRRKDADLPAELDMAEYEREAKAEFIRIVENVVQSH